MRVTRRELRIRRSHALKTLLTGALVCVFSLIVRYGISLHGIDSAANMVQADGKEDFPPAIAADFYFSSIFSGADNANAPPASPANDIDEKSEALTLNVYDHLSKTTSVMDLDEYVYHCLCAEVPASYEIEALKAQAVAIRTYAVNNIRQRGGSGCGKSSEADVCTDSSHCQSFVVESTLKGKWGG